MVVTFFLNVIELTIWVIKISVRLNEVKNMKLPNCKYKGTEMDLATLKDRADVGFEDHGLFVLTATFDYGVGCQGLGYTVDHKFIMKFIKAFGAEWLSKCSGEIFVEHAHGAIHRLIPLQTRAGEEFDIAKFIKRKGLKLNE